MRGFLESGLTNMELAAVHALQHKLMEHMRADEQAVIDLLTIAKSRQRQPGKGKNQPAAEQGGS